VLADWLISQPAEWNPDIGPGIEAGDSGGCAPKPPLAHWVRYSVVSVCDEDDLYEAMDWSSATRPT
jgi:hypothetical protein